MHVTWTFCRAQIPKSTHRRRSDISITNGIQKVSKFPLPRGFSFNVALLAWAIASGILIELFDSLLLSGKMKPKYADFVNTKMDLIDRNMTLGGILCSIKGNLSLNMTWNLLMNLKKKIIKWVSSLKWEEFFHHIFS